ncbi:YraN family protein [Rhizobium sp. TRM95796]|uniref:YraN family protein n=1 Tax=Rhizobium sp. TRM95796 TaxID=2979862 RepID=UPI0021E999CC|nr:YraN family protein [Rhizobium sp. TRM95796]MCV3768412.1 YraN family protein [Rhizobium sp. TRM95796]
MTAPSRDRRRAFLRGHVAEHIAAFYLIAKGYRIMAMRYKTRSGEIDIIARKKDLAVFIEVKARASIEDGLNAVTAETQERIRRASDIWISRRPHSVDLGMRYDVLVVRPWRWPAHFISYF